MKNNELRKLRDGYALQGFMYLPQVEPLLIDDVYRLPCEHASGLAEAQSREREKPVSMAPMPSSRRHWVIGWAQLAPVSRQLCSNLTVFSRTRPDWIWL
jgi:hypothetical protein